MKKARLIGNKGLARRTATAEGFSTIELMIAFAILSLVMGGAILAGWGSAYWAVAAETGSEALYHAKGALEDVTYAAQKNFQSATSSPMKEVVDTVCSAGGLCYYLEMYVTNASSCAKGAEARVTWTVDGYPTQSTSLATSLTNLFEAIAEGGDCALREPKGEWDGIDTAGTFSAFGEPTAFDVLDDNVYIGTAQSPYLEIVEDGGPTTFNNGFALKDKVNAIDVMRDIATDNTYAFIASASSTNQLVVLNVTDPWNPVLVAQRALSGVNHVDGAGWRVVYYGGGVYITTRYISGQPELHIFDTSNPADPFEAGSGVVSTSVYGLFIRDEQHLGDTKRMAYLATTHDAREVMVLNVSDPSAIAEVLGARTDLPGGQDALAIAMLGTTLYVGRESVTAGGEDLYSFDASAPFGATAGLSVQSSVDIGTGRHVAGFRASGKFLYTLTANTTNSAGRLEVRDIYTLLEKPSPHSISDVVDGGLELWGNKAYVLSKINPQVQLFESN